MNSLRARLLVLTLGGASVSLLVGGFALRAVTRDRLEAQFRGAMLTQVRTLAAAVVLDHGEIEVEASNDRNLPAIYVVATPEGELLAAAGEFHWEDSPPAANQEGAVVWSEVELGDDGDGQAVTLCTRAQPELDSEDEDEPTPPLAASGPLVTVTLVADRGPLDRTLGTIAATILATGAVVLGATAGVVWWGVRVGLRPLDSLADKMAGIQAEAPQPIGDVADAPAELQPVYDALDHMLARIGETMERERRFTDAAAHELRTPIAELRTTIDVARRWPEPTRTAAAIDSADLITDRMTGLIESLLVLSRNPGDLSSGDTPQVDLQSAIEEEAARIAEAAAAKNLTVTASGRRLATPWLAPEPLVTIGLRNLLANAVEYTPQGGEISIETWADDGSRALIISNGPVSVTQSQLARLFEPFWRSEDARSSRTHSGLGLTVVRHVCAGCGMECHADLEGATLRMTIREVQPPTHDAGERDA